VVGSGATLRSGRGAAATVDQWFPVDATAALPDDLRAARGQDGWITHAVPNAQGEWAMAATEDPPVVQQNASPNDADALVGQSIADLRQEVREQGRRIKGSQQAFSLFAVMALIIALASLVAIAFKLDRSPKTVVQNAPAAAATPATLAHNLDVTLAQFAVSPTATLGAAGHLTFRVHNAGSITHELVIVKTPRAAAELPIQGGRALESVNVGETGDMQPGATKSVSVNLAAGHYALICNLPGHYLAGQHTDFTVR
jgi:uncharacterized cupredoxin-like copper-binding protein